MWDSLGSKRVGTQPAPMFTAFEVLRGGSQAPTATKAVFLDGMRQYRACADAGFVKLLLWHLTGTEDAAPPPGMLQAGLHKYLVAGPRLVQTWANAIFEQEDYKSFRMAGSTTVTADGGPGYQFCLTGTAADFFAATEKKGGVASFLSNLVGRGSVAQGKDGKEQMIGWVANEALKAFVRMPEPDRSLKIGGNSWTGRDNSPVFIKVRFMDFYLVKLALAEANPTGTTLVDSAAFLSKVTAWGSDFCGNIAGWRRSNSRSPVDEQQLELAAAGIAAWQAAKMEEGQRKASKELIGDMFKERLDLMEYTHVEKLESLLRLLVSPQFASLRETLRDQILDWLIPSTGGGGGRAGSSNGRNGRPAATTLAKLLCADLLSNTVSSRKKAMAKSIIQNIHRFMFLCGLYGKEMEGAKDRFRYFVREHTRVSRRGNEKEKREEKGRTRRKEEMEVEKEKEKKENWRRGEALLVLEEFVSTLRF